MTAAPAEDDQRFYDDARAALAALDWEALAARYWTWKPRRKDILDRARSGQASISGRPAHHWQLWYRALGDEVDARLVGGDPVAFPPSPPPPGGGERRWIRTSPSPPPSAAATAATATPPTPSGSASPASSGATTAPGPSPSTAIPTPGTARPPGKRGTLTIATHPPGGPAVVTCAAHFYASGAVAVHQTLAPGPWCRWTVTHVATGLALGWTTLQGTAARLAEAAAEAVPALRTITDLAAFTDRDVATLAATYARIAEGEVDVRVAMNAHHVWPPDRSSAR